MNLISSAYVWSFGLLEGVTIHCLVHSQRDGLVPLSLLVPSKFVNPHPWSAYSKTFCQAGDLKLLGRVQHLLSDRNILRGEHDVDNGEAVNGPFVVSRHVTEVSTLHTYFSPHKFHELLLQLTHFIFRQNSLQSQFSSAPAIFKADYLPQSIARTFWCKYTCYQSYSQHKCIQDQLFHLCTHSVERDKSLTPIP